VTSRIRSIAFHEISLAILVAALVCPATGRAGADYRPPAREAAPGVRLVGPLGEATPVVNERGKLRLAAVDSAGQPIAVSSWECDSTDVAKVTRKGVLKGRRFGVATITARTALGDASAFAVVVRVGDRPGSRAQGDTKADTSGNVYLSSPRENVIFRATGLRDEVFAGARGQAGYRDGHGTQARFNVPTGLGVDNRADGGVYVADTENHCVRRVDFSGTATSALGRPEVPGTMPLDVTPLASAAMNGPRGVASVGRNFYFTDTGNHALYYADTQRAEVVLVAGQPGTAGLRNGRGREALFSRPSGLAISSDGSLLAVADTENGVVRLVSIARAPDGRVAGDVTTLGQASSARGAAAAAWREDRGEDAIAFDRPEAVSLDGAGNVYVVDAAGVSVVTRPRRRLPEKIALAQAGSLGDPVSVTISGIRALVLDEAAANPSRAVKVVEVGPPAIDSLSRDVDRIEGGAEVVVDGRNFTSESKLTLGDAEVVDYQVVSARRIVFRVPPQRATGGRTLSVVTRGGVAQAVFHIRGKSLAEAGVGEVVTIVGGGLAYLGDGGSAVGPAVGLSASDVTLDSAGNVYIADELNHRVRRLDPTTGVITSVAGNGSPEFSGDGGPGTSAGLREPRGVAVDSTGNVFIADTINYRIRRVDAVTGIITTVAGNGQEGGSTVDGGHSLAVALRPQGVSVDALGNLFVLESARVLRVDAITSIVTTVAGVNSATYNGDGIPATSAGVNPTGLAVDSAGNLYISDGTNHRVRRVDVQTNIITTVAGGGDRGDGGPAVAAALAYPSHVAVDGEGHLYVTENSRVRRIDANTGIITTIAGTANAGFSGDLGDARESRLSAPGSVVISGSGDLHIADTGNHRLRRVAAATQTISTVAGTGRVVFDGAGALATSASISFRDIAVDPLGDVVIADGVASRVYRVDAAAGVLSVIAGNGQLEFSGDGLPATATGVNPAVLAIDPMGDVYIGDIHNSRVYRVDARSGIITTVAGMGDAGSLDDDVPATTARLPEPRGLLVNARGDVFVADGSLRIRRVSRSTGIIDTVAGNRTSQYPGDGFPATEIGINVPWRIASTPAGEIFFVDLAFNQVRHIANQTTIVTTVAGNGGFEYVEDGVPATSTSLSLADIEVDSAGNLYLADSENARVRRVDRATGIITTVVVTRPATPPGGKKRRADPGSTADLPVAVAVDAQGNLYFADDDSVRVVKGGARP
jgi:sugar lactone lactonase YvrE